MITFFSVENYIICSSLNVFINKEEIVIEVKLVIKIKILDIAINSQLPAKATSDTKIDMVNPTLQIRETKNMEVQVKSFGFFVIPSKLNKYVKSIIPSGFPISNPR